ncbi:MAG: GTP-binding protein, partial [Polyangiaceae bacterium]
MAAAPETPLLDTDIEAYLAIQQRKELLRLLTCGSVDDGKSTLIGRLLHDSNMVHDDQLDALRRDSAKRSSAGGAIDYSLLVDGLISEREQGITIDVAYRYFATEKRKFIIADTPGHEQYTRNMATGASTADVAVILVDARLGVLPQTRRHSTIAALLGIRHVVVAVNKMDLRGYERGVFEAIRQEYRPFAEKLGFASVKYIPVSALEGDNVVAGSERMPWYEGPPLLAYLETVPFARSPEIEALRFPVQYVLRPDLTFRGFAGTIASGVVRPGMGVVCL